MNPLWSRLAEHLDQVPPTPTDAEIQAWIERYCWIIPKGTATSRQPIRLVFNAAQRYYWERHTDRDYIVKFRQGGFSTLILAEGFAHAVLEPHQNVLILAHTKEATKYLFGIVRQFYDRLPATEKRRLNGTRGDPQVSNQLELAFGNGSRITAMTAGSRAGARGRTLTFVHLSEVAYYREWAGDVIGSIEGALVANGRIRLETTPNMAGSWAYQTWQSSLESERPPYQPMFLPWWLHQEYQTDPARGEPPDTPEEAQGRTQFGWTAAQVAWRREQQQKLDNPFLFKTEYPEDPLSGWLKAGRTVFHIPFVLDAFGGLPPTTVDRTEGWREYVPPDPDQTYWIGVDPAEGVPGGDYSTVQIFSGEGEQVAEWAGYLPVTQLAQLLRTLRYPPAKIMIERNNHGHALIESLRGSHLPLRLDKDRRPGLVANRQSKAAWIARATHGFWQHGFRLHSYRLYQQLTQYLYDDEDHASGPNHGGDNVLAHDDLVSAFLLVSWELVDPRDRSRQTPISLQQWSIPAPTPKPASVTHGWRPPGEAYAPETGLYLPPGSDFRLPSPRCTVCHQTTTGAHPPLRASLWQIATLQQCPGCGRSLTS